MEALTRNSGWNVRIEVGILVIECYLWLRKPSDAPQQGCKCIPVCHHSSREWRMLILVLRSCLRRVDNPISTARRLGTNVTFHFKLLEATNIIRKLPKPQVVHTIERGHWLLPLPFSASSRTAYQEPADTYTVASLQDLVKRGSHLNITIVISKPT